MCQKFLGGGRKSVGSTSEGGPAGQKLLGSVSEVRAGGRAPGGSRFNDHHRGPELMDSAGRSVEHAHLVIRWGHHGALLILRKCATRHTPARFEIKLLKNQTGSGLKTQRLTP